MSYSERIFWRLVGKDRLGLRFRRQARVGRWYLDFYCPAALVNVEIDGEQHAERAEKDASRDEFLMSKGIVTFRIPSLALQDGFEYSRFYRRVCAILQERTGKEAGMKW